MSSVIFNGTVFVVCTTVTVICSINASYFNKIVKAEGAVDGSSETLVSTKAAQTMLAFNLILALVTGAIVLLMMYSGFVTMYNRVCVGGPKLPAYRFPSSPVQSMEAGQGF
jgi:hypothetical protein